MPAIVVPTLSNGTVGVIASVTPPLGSLLLHRRPPVHFARHLAGSTDASEQRLHPRGAHGSGEPDGDQ